MKNIRQKKASNHAGWWATMGQIRLEDPSGKPHHAACFAEAGVSSRHRDGVSLRLRRTLPRQLRAHRGSQMLLT
jgi:hypothetical protein